MVFFDCGEWCSVDDSYLVSVSVKCLLCQGFFGIGYFLVGDDDFFWVLCLQGFYCVKVFG